MRGRSHPLLRGRQKSKPKTWYERGNGIARLAHERALVAEAYPSLTYHINDNDEICLEGPLVYRTDCGVPDEINVLIVFPFDYPNREPRAYDASEHFPHDLDRHFYDDGYLDGRCCLWLPPNSPWDSNNPDSLREFLDETAVFFERQLIFDATGKWPGKEYSHGAKGFLNWIQEMLDGDERMIAVFRHVLSGSSKVERNQMCPCISGRKYKKCHLGIINEIRRKIRLSILQKLFC